MGDWEDMFGMDMSEDAFLSLLEGNEYPEYYSRNLEFETYQECADWEKLYYALVDSHQHVEMVEYYKYSTKNGGARIFLKSKKFDALDKVIEATGYKPDAIKRQNRNFFETWCEQFVEENSAKEKFDTEIITKIDQHINEKSWGEALLLCESLVNNRLHDLIIFVSKGTSSGRDIDGLPIPYLIKVLESVCKLYEFEIDEKLSSTLEEIEICWNYERDDILNLSYSSNLSYPSKYFYSRNLSLAPRYKHLETYARKKRQLTKYLRVQVGKSISKAIKKANQRRSKKGADVDNDDIPF